MNEAVFLFQVHLAEGQEEADLGEGGYAFGRVLGIHPAHGVKRLHHQGAQAHMDVAVDIKALVHDVLPRARSAIPLTQSNHRPARGVCHWRCISLTAYRVNPEGCRAERGHRLDIV